MKSIILEPEQLEYLGGEIIRSCTIKRMDNDVQVDLQKLWFRFPDGIKPPEENDCDSYLLAFLMDAMSESRNVIVKGSVSGELLSNLIEYQSVWNKWLPEIYNIVDIKVDAIRDFEASILGAVCAFSGGVDATFSVWRHTQKRNSYRSQAINLCVFAHGFDIPLSDKNAFENAKNIATETLRDIDLSLVPIKTNYREISNVNWEHSHGCALVAALNNFKKVAGACIIGSSDSYDKLITPWGSSPIIDHLLSSDDFKVIHDGSSHHRAEKLSEISDWKMGIDNLRVCWQGDLKDRNCGNCEKCLRTQCNFLANGHHIPSCFPEWDTEITLNNFTIHGDGLRGEWVQILGYAHKNSIKQPWVLELESKLENKKTIIDFVLPRGSLRRKIMRKIKSKI